MIECDGCGLVYDGTRYRWLCPQCHLKSSCCEGAPLPYCEQPSGAADLKGAGPGGTVA